MTDTAITVDQADTNTDETFEGRPSHLVRLMPAVTFGLRTAALAGIVISAGSVAAGLTGLFDDTMGTAWTTCCGGEIDEQPV